MDSSSFLNCKILGPDDHYVPFPAPGDSSFWGKRCLCGETTYKEGWLRINSLIPEMAPLVEAIRNMEDE